MSRAIRDVHIKDKSVYNIEHNIEYSDLHFVLP